MRIRVRGRCSYRGKSSFLEVPFALVVFIGFVACIFVCTMIRCFMSDKQLFDDAMAGVTPLAQDTVHHRPRKLATNRSAGACKAADTDALPQTPVTNDNYAEPTVFYSGLDVLSFKRAGIQHRVFRQLRLGLLLDGPTIDLHGCTVADARVAVHKRLLNTHDQWFRCALVIHGKGLRALQGQAVLKSYLAMWLEAHQDVLAFHSATASEGGTGAVYVLLRNSR